MAKKCIVASCVVMKNRKVLLLWHTKLGKWLYPGGHVEDGEVPTDTALRETLEETGYKVNIINKKTGRKPMTDKVAKEVVMPITILYEKVPYSTGIHYHFDMAYLANIVGKRKKIGKGESKILKWFSEDEIDGIDTFNNLRLLLHLAFDINREMEAE